MTPKLTEVFRLDETKCPRPRDAKALTPKLTEVFVLDEAEEPKEDKTITKKVLQAIKDAGPRGLGYSEIQNVAWWARGTGQTRSDSSVPSGAPTSARSKGWWGTNLDRLLPIWAEKDPKTKKWKLKPDRQEIKSPYFVEKPSHSRMAPGPEKTKLEKELRAALTKFYELNKRSGFEADDEGLYPHQPKGSAGEFKALKQNIMSLAHTMNVARVAKSMGFVNDGEPSTFFSLRPSGEKKKFQRSETMNWIDRTLREKKFEHALVELDRRDFFNQKQACDLLEKTLKDEGFDLDYGSLDLNYAVRAFLYNNAQVVSDPQHDVTKHTSSYYVSGYEEHTSYNASKDALWHFDPGKTGKKHGNPGARGPALKLDPEVAARRERERARADRLTRVQQRASDDPLGTKDDGPKKDEPEGSVFGKDPTDRFKKLDYGDAPGKVHDLGLDPDSTDVFKKIKRDAEKKKESRVPRLSDVYRRP